MSCWCCQQLIWPCMFVFCFQMPIPWLPFEHRTKPINQYSTTDRPTPLIMQSPHHACSSYAYYDDDDTHPVTHTQCTLEHCPDNLTDVQKDDSQILVHTSKWKTLFKVWLRLSRSDYRIIYCILFRLFGTRRIGRPRFLSQQHCANHGRNWIYWQSSGGKAAPVVLGENHLPANS